MKAIFVDRSIAITQIDGSGVKCVSATMGDSPDGQKVKAAFPCDKMMLDSMEHARRACLANMVPRQFGRRLGTFLGDLWSGPLEIRHPASWLALISLLGWLGFALNRKYLPGIPFWDLPLPHFHWLALLGFFTVPVIFFLLSGWPKDISWRKMPAVLGRARVDTLLNTCFTFNIGEGAQNQFFSDISAGVAFFCACAVAVIQNLIQNGRNWLVPLWGWQLLEDRGSAGSAGVDALGVLTSVGWDGKLEEIRAYNRNHPEDPITRLIHSEVDCGEVQAHWQNLTQKILVWKKHWFSKCLSAKSLGLEFIACPDIRAFCRFLNKNNRGAVLRTFALMIALLTLFIPIADIPDVKIETEPRGYIEDYLYRVELPPGEVARLFIEVNKSGYPGRLRFSVESNEEKLLRLDPKDDLKKWIRNQPIRQNELKAVYFTMPSNPSGDVSVIITVVNRANKPFQPIIFFSPKREY